MAFSSIIMLPLLLLFLAIWAGLIYLLILLIRALRKYLRGGEARREKAETCRTLGEILKAHRMRCQMTQEFVAESLGVSRQAVHDAVSKSEKSLRSYEEKLGLAKRFLLREEDIRKAYEALDGIIRRRSEDGELIAELRSIRDILDRLGE